MMNIDGLVGKIRNTVASHRISEGVYARWLWQDSVGSRELGVNEYGCADAANILYTIGDFPQEPEKRAEWVKVLRGMQNPETGMYTEKTHHTIHTTAHCLAALELFDAQPEHRVKALLPYLEKEKMETLLAGLRWYDHPWRDSHEGAGMYASLVITREASLEWQDWYFDYLRENCDPDYGMSRKGTIDGGSAPHYEHLYGWFHYLFNHNYAHMPIPYADRLIDTCLRLYEEKALGARFGMYPDFKEVDWVFCLHRASLQTAHRKEESQAALMDFASRYIPRMESLDWNTCESVNDLHCLFGGVCTIAELQLALPGVLRSTVPLKSVLDRRPFI